MFLKLNINNCKYDTREILYNSIKFDKSKSMCMVECPSYHNLNIGDEIVFSHNLFSGTLVKENCKIIEAGFNEKGFSVLINNEFYLIKRSGSNNTHIVELSGKLSYKLDDENKEYPFIYNNCICKLKSIGNNLFSLDTIINNNGEEKNIFGIDVENGEYDFYNSSFEIEFDEVSEIKGDNIKIFHNINYLTLPIGLTNNFKSELNDEFNAQFYFNEKKDELITKIIDYEKKCFTPYNYVNGNLLPVYDIKFNLFFRNRNNNYTEWNTNDELYWNIDYSAKTSYNGDLLGYLGFIDDDVYYRKEKLNKSFLRLSFYDSKDPFTQMLLFYSTIFLDTGELFSKYIKNINKKDINIKNSLVLNKDSDLRCSFTILDRFQHDKSSEGFYLYMFPDYLDGTGRTVYMKAEFNHAGYGKTIPLIVPQDGNNPINFGDKSFPKHLVTADNYDIKKYFDYLYVPVTLKYDKNKKEYIYYFNLNFSKSNAENNNIVINLYEPKLNGQ